jgi:hypothetical protein
MLFKGISNDTRNLIFTFILIVDKVPVFGDFTF